MWWGLFEAEEGFHLYHHELLPSESALVDPPALLVVVGNVVIDALRLRDWLRDLGDIVVPGTEGLLLYNSGSWLRDNSFANSLFDSPTHSVSHAAPHSATYAASHATHHYPPAAHSETWTC